ncbi:hypothetical protein FUAX_55750 (plasmid) [Fulvitalea axinellae]|uniref:Peptidase S49 domain-containing protein n=2 Tax=Fulvitalea axinellae TaxID=1182444 RepID=A0AAU9CYW5_9BACT|nr:hypothetical protein FUAX_55750 [Fulvitalea axinellae]
MGGDMDLDMDRKTEHEKEIIASQNLPMAGSGGESEEFDWWLRGYNPKTGRVQTKVNRFSDLPDGSVAIIRNVGAMMKADQWCGPMGSETKERILMSAVGSDNIVGIVWECDSGGGMVAGTESLAGTLEYADKIKPTITFVNGMTCSACYWTASKTRHIMMGGKTSEVGSIGTMISWWDMQGYYEEQGYKLHTIRASKSTDKNEDFYQAQKGNYEPIIKETLDPINEEFHASVKASRPGIDKDCFSGKVYFTAKALENGLADSEGTLQDAIDFVLAEAENKTGSNSSNDNETEMSTEKKSLKQSVADAVASALGADDMASKVTALEGERDSAQASLATAEKERDDAQTAKTKAEGDLATAKTRISELEAEVTRLGGLTNTNKDRVQNKNTETENEEDQSGINAQIKAMRQEQGIED